MTRGSDDQSADREQLVSKSMSSLGWAEALRALAERAVSEPGKRLCLDPPLYGIAAACEQALDETAEMVGFFVSGDAPPATPIGEVSAEVETARAGGMIEPLSLVKIMDLLEYAGAAASFYANRDEAPRLCAWGSRLDGLGRLRRSLAQCVDRDGSILDGASSTLKSLRSKRRVLNERIHRRLSEIIARESDAVLQDAFYTQRGSRFVVPVKAGQRSRFEGIVHDASGSGQTVFVEPAELVEPNNRLRLIDGEIEEEIIRILKELAAAIAESADQIITNQRTLAHLDFVRARARLAADLKAHRPRMNDRGELSLKNARHPLLALRGDKVVGNDLALGGRERVLVVSGPNAGGKTVLLTMLGLYALTSRAGMFVPADPDSSMAVFGEVYAVIGDEQDLSLDLSSFSAHLLDLRRILGVAGPGSLVLLDELMNSTDPEEGAALAMALLSRLYDQGAQVVATTHLPQLKSFAHDRKGFANASFAFNPDDFTPTYRVMAGVPGRSMGIEMAARLGMPPELVADARSRLDESALRMESLIGDLSSRLSAVDAEGAELERVRRETEALAKEYRSLVGAAERREREARKTASDSIRRAVNRAETELAEVMNELKAKRERTHEDGQRARRRMEAARKKLEAQYGDSGLAGASLDWSRVVAGSRVLVLPLAIEAEVVAVPAGEVKDQTEVRIRIGQREVLAPAAKLRGMPEVKVGAGIDLLRPERKKPKKDKAAPYQPPAGSEALGPALPMMPQVSKNTLDLRGLRYYEAEARVEHFVDHALSERLANVFIIHGHGTGALKKMVREFLAESSQVEEFRPGKQGEGGDGVTMAVLRV